MQEIFRRNLDEVRGRIADAAAKSGREADDVKLVAVTKYVDADITRQLVLAGATTLGENRPQVLGEKAAALSDLEIEWHMIGSLQRNKIKKTVSIASLLHSLDRDSLVESVARHGVETDQVIDCLLEVNVSGETSKHGYAADQVGAVIEKISQLESIRLCGLMCMAGLAGDDDDARREFAMLRELRDRHVGTDGSNIELKHLSMGMSGDFESAIEEGATIVRVGSALFRDVL